MIYLPSHLSHILQPLDLSVFSRIKSSYRAQIEALAYLEDSAPIKKIHFVRYYNQARRDGLQEKYIVAGWRGAGLFPWNPEKVLKSRQILDITTSLRTSFKRRAISSFYLNILKNKRQLIEAQNELVQNKNLPRSVRSFFGKTAKAFDQLHVDKAVDLQQINAQAIRLQELTQKTKKKPVVNSNERFVDIENIKAAHDKQQRQLALLKSRDMASEAQKTAQAVTGMSIAEMSTVFSIFDQTE